jgi:glycine cleavage system H lipoate-binding protein/TusA-related sulfurtransferase
MMKINHCIFPKDILYDAENFVWADIHHDKRRATLGITSILGYISGKISTITLKEVGSYINRGKSFGTLESLRYFGVVRAPISGRIIEVNRAVMDQPKLANDLPYNEGWFARMEVSNIEAEIRNLQPIESCHENVANLIQKHHIICFGAFPDYEIFQIGVECAATLAKLDELLEKITVGKTVHLVSDDITSDLEMVRWSDQTGQSLLETRREGNLFHFIVKKMK